MNKLPETSSAGKKWTDDEDNQLIESLNSGTSIEDIAKQHKRTVGAIKSRIKKNVVHVRMVNIRDICKTIVSSIDPKSVEDISEMVNFKPAEMKEYLQQKKQTMTPEAYLALISKLVLIMDN